MVISYRLLKELLNFPYTPEELGELLTNIGIEVEKIEEVKKQFDGVFTAKVVEVSPIPHTKLYRVRVTLGEEDYTVITAANNVRKDDIVPFAKVGAILANGIKIEPKVFEGITSVGMLCSYNELGLETFELSTAEKAGILILPSDTPIGFPFQELFPVEDTYLTLSLLPDRADAFYAIGVARWIEIIMAREEGRKADFSKIKTPHFTFDAVDETPFDIEIVHKAHCEFYSGRLIKNVTIKSSSFNLRRELFKLYIKPVNNIVDITNYIAKMYGQPLHAFDFDKLKGHIIVRLAKDGEHIRTLDGIERTLDSSKNLVIADVEKPVAIAGVMGGEETAISNETKNILLESAYFNPSIISKSSRSLGLITDASMLFEKGVDREFTALASSIATEFIIKEAGGIPFRERVKDYRTPKQKVMFRIEKASHLLGEKLERDEIKQYFDFEGLGYEEKDEGLFMITPPTFRQDIKIEEDVVEEIVRMRGYNDFPETPIVSILKGGRIEDEMKFNDTIREFMVDLGLNEILTSTLTSKELLSKFNMFDEKNTIRILNPLTEDIAYLRPNLFVTNIDVALRNFNFGIESLSLFEIGKVFFGQNEFKEEYHLSIFLSGVRVYKNPYGRSLPYDYFYLKGLIEELFEFLKIKDTTTKEKNLPHMHPYQTGEILLNGEPIGYAGKIHPDYIENAYFAELNLSKLFQVASFELHFVPFSIYPSVKRDIAVVVDKDMEEYKVRKAILCSNIKELKNIVLFDVYTGPPLPPDKKNLAYALEFVSEERTLTSSEVDAFITRIEKILADTVNGILRKE